MANGDTYTILSGKWRGYTKLDIERTTATSHSIVDPASTKKIHVPEAVLTVAQAGTIGRFLEETSNDVVGGPYESPTGATAMIININGEDEALHTNVKGKDLTLDFSVSAPVVGYIVYKEV